MQETLSYLVLEIVKEVPKGKVVSYQQLARMAGYPKNARLVGKIMSHADFYGDYPCHRVVHNDGRLVSSWPEQYHLLESEGVIFHKSGKVNMKECQWRELYGD